MYDDILEDIDIIIDPDTIQEPIKENRIQLEIPDYYNYNNVEEVKKPQEEPRRVIIIELWVLLHKRTQFC